MARQMKTPDLPDAEQSNGDKKTKVNILNQYLTRPSINILLKDILARKAR